MATNTNYSVWQKRELFRLLKIERRNKGVAVKELKDSILEVRATMSEADIAAVEKEIAQLPD